MDIYGFTLAFERASNSPTMNGHRVVFRRLRELIEAHDLDGFTSLMTDVNRRMPGAPLSDLAHVWATWRNREDDIADLVRHPDWIRSREIDEMPSQHYEQSIQGRDVASLRDELMRLADIKPAEEHSPSRKLLEVTVDQPRFNLQSSSTADGSNAEQQPVDELNPIALARIDSPVEEYGTDATHQEKPKSVMTTWAVCTLVVSICAGLLLYAFLGPS